MYLVGDGVDIDAVDDVDGDVVAVPVSVLIVVESDRHRADIAGAAGGHRARRGVAVHEDPQSAGRPEDGVDLAGDGGRGGALRRVDGASTRQFRDAARRA